VIPGPSILGVPVLIMPTYFGMGYMSYTVSCILNNQFGDAVKGIKVFTVPLIGTFIMVMWDLVMDPVATNIQNAWVWKEPGLYFNVPLSNYFGWCLVVYLFLQIFSIINAKTPVSLANGKFSKLFWLPASTVIGMQGVSHVIQGFFLHPSNAILLSTSLISIFTLCFVALISALSIFEKKNEAVLSLTAKG
jgi:putative membrane protein